MFASQDPADKPLREVRETIATMRDPRELPRGSRRILRRNRRFVSNLWESSQISGRPKRGFRILHVFEFRNDLSRENVWLDRAAIVDQWSRRSPFDMT